MSASSRGVPWSAYGTIVRLALVALTATVLVCATFASEALGKPTPNRPFSVVPGSFRFVPSVLQAGAHADWTTSFDFAHNTGGETFNDVRSIWVELPAGFIGSTTAVPACSDRELVEAWLPVSPGVSVPACPAGSTVGQLSFTIGGKIEQHVTVPLYNMEITSPGVTAELGLSYFRTTTVMPIYIRPNDSGITFVSPNIQDLGEVRDITATVWAVPASPVHDRERQYVCGEGSGCEDLDGGSLPAGVPIKPYLSNPTSCVPGIFTSSMRADSWETPEAWSAESTLSGPIVECERVPFRPSIEVQPTTDSAESPSGLNVTLRVPQNWDEPYTISSSDLKDATVALPIGYTLNPSAGSGLLGCAPEEYERETASSLPGAGCPPQSKLGTVTIETPLLADKIEGNAYLAQPFDNPFDSLLAMYVVAKDPARGILVKVAGLVQADPMTGQLTSTFRDNPQVPFSKLTLRFRQGATSPLVSPPTCGAYTAIADLTPWSAPSAPREVSSPPFEVEKGIGAGACPAARVPPFAPQAIAGSQSNAAASYSPFYLRIVRQDGEQEITRFSTIMPPGLTGNLTGIPFCPDTAIQAARQSSGRQEIEHPACPQASEIGRSLTGAGVGSVLAWTPGKIYLAGSYHGAPLSLVSITSATVGPFDLGTVVIRFALRINPVTAQVEIDSNGSDPIPHIIDGIVVHVRDIHVYIDRSRFIRNPTNCAPLNILDTIAGAGANPSDPTNGQQTVQLQTRFQAADCRALRFKPIFRAFTTAHTTRTIGASLHVTITYPKTSEITQANIKSVRVSLPRQLPSRLTTLQKACPDTIFQGNHAACPATSRVGTATAVTPILPVPLTGPAYFVSHGGAKFPELVIVLQGYGVTIELHGETYIDKKGITTSFFRTVPDQPVTTFQLTLPQGPNSALAANGSLCAKALHLPTTITSQNNTTIRQNTPLTVTHCKKHTTHHKRKKRH